MNNKKRNEEILKLVCEMMEMMNLRVDDAFVEDAASNAVGTAPTTAGKSNAVGVDASLSEEKESSQVLIGLKMENPAHLIGYKGKNLAALQLILAMMVKGKLGEWVRVVVDVNNYREEQKARLENLVRSTVEKVKATGREMALLPMSAFERRICHMEAAKIEGLVSESEGEGEERRVIIKPVESVKIGA